MTKTSTPPARDLISSAASALKSRIEEVNRLNVFPVPDGDTGTNMSLTMDTVLAEVAKLGADASLEAVCHAITHGSLMGARGNSGVILSQILRGLCEGIVDSTEFDAAAVSRGLSRAAEVAYQAVRKPVEGTMLTVVKDAALAASQAAEAGLSLSEALERVDAATVESVKRTPELLEVLRENGVVDAGGFGLSILVEGFTAAALGRSVTVADVSLSEGVVTIEPVDDWDDDEYLYCTEFLLFGDSIDREAVHDFMASVGGSELVVGEGGSYKVHVHTDDPGSVLMHVTALGEVAEVHINNMRRQTAERDRVLKSEHETAPRKPLGFVAVAAGVGLADILTSLGVDVVVSGGQTMNPSTADLVEAIGRVNADKVIILPNNKNIIMAATAAATVADRPVGVVPTRSVPQAFSALLAYGGGDELESVVEEMTSASEYVTTGEVTTAVKDAKGKVGDIRAGQVIGIVNDSEIEVAGDDVLDVAESLAGVISGADTESLTILAGEDLSDEDLATLEARLSARLSGIAIESHRGEQPLYPVILSAE